MNSKSFRNLTCERLESRFALALNGGVVISEVMYHPTIDPQDEAAGFKETDFEFIELQNVSQQALELSGVELDSGISFRFGSFIVGPGEHAIVVKNRSAISRRYGQDLPVAGEFNGTLSNGSDRIQLKDRLGTEVLDFEYSDNWYPTTDGAGHSLNVSDPLANADAWQKRSGWKPSQHVSGSPGFTDGDSPSDLTSIPRNLVATAVSSRHVDLTWEPPLAPADPITAYKVYRDGTLLSSSTTITFRDSTAGPNQMWRYQVSTVNTLGKESPRGSVAAVTIEPLGGETRFADGQDQGLLASVGRNELSGMAASRLNQQVLWVNNDGASGNSIHAINFNGEYLAEVFLDGMQPTDWEDIAVGPGPADHVSYIFVGDIGDNESDRESIQVFLFVEPTIDRGNLGQSIAIAPDDYRVFDLIYPDGPHDAEVLLVDPVSGDLYVVAKESQESRVYLASAADMAAGARIELQNVGSVKLDVPSGGDIAPDGSEILLRNEDEAIVFRRGTNQTVMEALAGMSTTAPVIGRPAEPNGEAIAYDPENRGYFTVSEGEGQSLYFFERLGPAKPGDANRDGRFDSSDLVQVFQQGRYATEQPAQWSQGDWTGDGLFDSSDLVAAFQLGAYQSDARLPAPSDDSRDVDRPMSKEWTVDRLFRIRSEFFS